MVWTNVTGPTQSFLNVTPPTQTFSDVVPPSQSFSNVTGPTATFEYIQVHGFYQLENGEFLLFEDGNYIEMDSCWGSI